MDIGQIFHVLFFIPLTNVLILIYQGLTAAHIPGALGFAIALFGILFKLVTWPLTGAQLKSAQKMASLKPHLDQLKVKHKEDKQAFGAAQLALYKEHGVNPAAGCLPALIQIPIFFQLVNVINNLFKGDEGLRTINAVLHPSLRLSGLPDPNFLGLNLSTHPGSFVTNWANPASYFSIPLPILLIPLITAALAFVQSKMMQPASPLKIYKNDKAKEVKQKVETEDAMASMQTQMTYMMPIMFGVFAFQFPIGLAIYYNMFTIMGIIQQYSVSGWGGLTDLIKKYGRTTK
jgi:YidC/Oxa1 family membrane protein insertase